MGHHFGVFGNLSHRAPHAALAHAVRATEVQLETIHADILGAFDNVVPRLAFRFDHQRRDEGVFGIFALAPFHFAQVDFGRTVANQFDVGQPDHALRRASVDGGEARADVANRFADGFPDGAAPPGVKGALDHRTHVGRRRRGEPERIGRLDARKISL